MRRFYTLFLRIVTLFLLVLAAGQLLVSGISVHTSLYDLLPSSDSPGAQSLSHMAKSSNRQVNVLVYDSVEEKAWKLACDIRKKLPQSVRPLMSETTLAAVSDILYPFRFQLLSPRHRAMLIQHGASDDLRDEALSNLYSFVPMSLFSVDADPYGFTTSFLLENPLVRQNGYEVRDGVLMAQQQGVHYAYMPLLLPEEAVNSLPMLQQIMQELSACCKGENVLIAGTPVHTWRASTSSQSAITMLGILSAIIVAALFVCVFNSLRGMFVMIATLLFAGVTSVAAVTLLHSSVHILALVFGCSLVGISTDYIVHYLVNRHQSVDANIELPLRKALMFGLLTSTIGYASFYATQVELLFQIATISVVGLSSAMLFIFAFYPLLFSQNKPMSLTVMAQRVGAIVARWRIPVWLPWGCCLVFFALSVWRLEVNDDLRSFYRPDPSLIEAERKLAKLNGMEQGLITIYVKGDNEEEILQRQERLTTILHQHGISAGSSVSSLVPSVARQKENFELVRKQVLAFAEDVPLDTPDAFASALLPHQLMGENSPFNSLASLWDKSGGLLLIPGAYRQQLSCVTLPEWAVPADRFSDLQHQITDWRETLMLLLVIVVALILFFLCFYAGFRSALCVAGPVIAGVLAVFGGLALCGKPLTLFHVLACYLVLGLGCDYAIFKASSAASDTSTSLAVMISFITSWSMFGVLAFTDFSVTQDIGVAVSLGLSAAYVLSPAATGAATRLCKASCVSRK